MKNVEKNEFTLLNVYTNRLNCNADLLCGSNVKSTDLKTIKKVNNEK